MVDIFFTNNIIDYFLKFFENLSEWHIWLSRPRYKTKKHTSQLQWMKENELESVLLISIFFLGIFLWLLPPFLSYLLLVFGNVLSLFINKTTQMICDAGVVQD